MTTTSPDDVAPTIDLRELLHVLEVVRDGNFSVRMPGHLTGIGARIAHTLNDVIDCNRRVAEELVRVGQVVGKEGQTRQRVRFGRASGAWAQMETSVNLLIDDLLWPTTQVTGAIAAVAQGDLLKTVPLEVDGAPLQGEFLRSATIVNTMIAQLGVFTSEVTRVAREVGTDGKLGGQAEVKDVSGVWKDLTDSVNQMASNLTGQVRNIAEVTIAVARGDLSRKITVDVRGEILQLKETINTMVDQLRSFASEVTRVAREVGTDGKLGGQAVVPGVAGTWQALTDSVNSMANNLTDQVRNIAGVATAIAGGDLSKKITVDVRGEILQLKETVNTVVDQLNAFASEVTRVAREVGTEGKLGGQAVVRGVAGTWKDLTDSVNSMASNLTAQVRNIAEVTTAVARGDLSRKITVDVQGEILELKDTINTMVDQLNAFASEVTRVAREVGTDGKLGGQAAVPGVAGTWKDLTDNVNSMASNLTDQVRNIAGVATAIAQGDLSKKITVDVRGEILQLKQTMNTMVDQLNAFAAEVTRVAREVGTEGKLGGQAQVAGVAGTWKDLTDNVNVMANNLTEQVRGIVKIVTAVADGDLKQNLTVKAKGEVAALAETINNMTNTLAIFAQQVTTVAHEVGVEGRLGGQANVPGAAGTWKDLTANVNLLAANLTTQVRAIAEVATAVTRGDLTRAIQVDARGEVSELKDNINTMIRNLRLTTERNTEARRAVEEKAAELALTSKYKSEFLANMSHELRTPLNSILILGQQLAGNADENLTDKQVEFARTIHGAGTDLLNLITDILDLSKIESGTVTVDVEEIHFDTLIDALSRVFRHEAETRGLSFDLHVSPELGRTIVSDPKRLQQILKNLLSNAFKFTERGGVTMSIWPAAAGWDPEHAVLGSGAPVVAFEVSDTGIGIPAEKQKIVFEAFQQADASTSRKYGGTGLGLAISRELTNLLGGELHLRSAPDQGSTFTLYLPLSHVGPSVRVPTIVDGQPRGPAAYQLPRTVERPIERVADDRDKLQPDVPTLLIIEDDAHYARLMCDLARDEGFQVLVANRGADALALVRQHRPAAISLDLFLPDMLGWTVLNEVKRDPATRHIPVQIVTVDEQYQHGLSRGAFSFVTKPATPDGLIEVLKRVKAFVIPRKKRLLVVEDDAGQRLSIMALLAHDDIDVVAVTSGEEALGALRESSYDCMVLDLRLPDMSGFEVLERLRDEFALLELPVVVFTGKELTPDEEARLHLLAHSVIVKGVESPERLLDETSLLLHRVVADLPPQHQQMLEKLHGSDEDLRDRSVLVVDDDMRNIFALSSVLERRGMRVLTASTGHEAIAIMAAKPEISIVLMDIMMPGMDGYRTMEAIRQNRAFRRLPILALTAKAMKGDREKCLAAGASDYLAKPVDTEQLLSAMRMWLHR